MHISLACHVVIVVVVVTVVVAADISYNHLHDWRLAELSNTIVVATATAVANVICIHICMYIYLFFIIVPTVELMYREMLM